MTEPTPPTTAAGRDTPFHSHGTDTVQLDYAFPNDGSCDWPGCSYALRVALKYLLVSVERTAHDPAPHNPNEDGVCGGCAVIQNEARAALAALPPSAPPALEVERLAKALQAAWPTHTEGMGGTGDPPEGGWPHWEVIDPAYPSDALAEAIAAEYARLSEPTE